MRTNHFMVQIVPPPSIQMSANLEYKAEQVSLPGVNFALHDVRRYGYGPIEKRPTSHTFNDLQVIFYTDGDMDNYRFFQQWLSQVASFDMRSGITTAGAPYLLNYKSSYVTDINIRMFNSRGTALRVRDPDDAAIAQAGPPALSVMIREAFPVTMTDTQLNWSDNNSIMRFQVSFAYSDWYIETLGE